MPIHREFITVVGKPGAYLSNTQKQIRTINVPVLLLADDLSDLQKVKEDLANWLIHDEPKELIFNDEPDRVYYAVVSGSLDLDELVYSGQGIITFLCPDPFKYGHEKTIHFPSDQVVINNEGTAEADPIFELTATKKSTFAMISNGEDYNLIGQPSDDDVQVVDYKTSVLYENGSTLNGWQHTQNKEMVANDNNIDSMDGVMGTSGTGIRPSNYGTPKNKQRGPAIYKELNEPLQDFELEATVDIITNKKEDNFRVVIYMLDENMNNIGYIGMKDNSKMYNRRVPLSQLGKHQEGQTLLGDYSNYIRDSDNTTMFYLRFKREGKRLTAYVALLKNQRHEIVWEESFNDVNNEYMGRLKYITLFIGSYQDRITPARLNVNKVELFKLTTVEEDQTPYIINVGDVIEFDHKNEDILVNGEPRKDLKNFGASFFTLKKGENQLLVTPENSFETNVRFRERFY